MKRVTYFKGETVINSRVHMNVDREIKNNLTSQNKLNSSYKTSLFQLMSRFILEIVVFYCIGIKKSKDITFLVLKS